MHIFSNEKERFLTFHESLSLKDNIDKDTKFLLDLKEYAINNDVPIITDECKELLSLVLNIKRPKEILELGTAIGYSALTMLNFLDNEVHIDTVENYPPRIIDAKNNFKKLDKNNKITLYDEDIDKFLDDNKVKFKNKYDFIFLDAAKAQYIFWLPILKEMLNDKGIIFADNVLCDKDIFESRYTVRKRDRSIHKRMKEYLHAIFNDKELDSYLYDIGDGVSISIINKK